MWSKFVLFCFIYVFRIISEAIEAPEKTVQITQSELDDLKAKRDELVIRNQQHETDLKTWLNEKKTLQDENKNLKNKVKDLQDDMEPMEKKLWTLLWFRWLSMIKNEIEWRETAVTNFTFNRKLYEEEKSKTTIWTEEQEFHRQIWNEILLNYTHNPHIVSLVHEIDKTGIEIAEFSKNIAFGYHEISNKLLSMMRWRNLPKFEKEPTFDTPITWSLKVNKCLLTLMFDVDKYLVWDFKTKLPIDQATEKAPNKP